MATRMTTQDYTNEVDDTERAIAPTAPMVAVPPSAPSATSGPSAPSAPYPPAPSFIAQRLQGQRARGGSLMPIAPSPAARSLPPPASYVAHGPATPMPWVHRRLCALPVMLKAVLASAAVWAGLAVAAIAFAFGSSISLVGQIVLVAIAAYLMAGGAGWVVSTRPETA